MLKKFKLKIGIKKEIISLIFLIIITAASTAYYNFTKNQINYQYKEILGNVYFKKTLNHIIDELEPRFKKISHKIKAGETFDNILEQYSIKEDDIISIKNTLSKKINLNKLNTNQKIHLTIDQTDNKIIKFLFQVSNKERIILTQDLQKKTFNQKKEQYLKVIGANEALEMVEDTEDDDED